MGRGQEGRYYLFCLDHVRQFNASYNYFDGWSNAEVEAFQKDAVIGHRPTWKAGSAGEGPKCSGRVRPRVRGPACVLRRRARRATS